jgi:hypothetical protein
MVCYLLALIGSVCVCFFGQSFAKFQPEKYDFKTYTKETKMARIHQIS